jgi:hypothetical protein
MFLIGLREVALAMDKTVENRKSVKVYCLCDGLLCTNYRLLKDGNFAFRCRRCKRLDKEFVEKVLALWGNEEFTVIPSVDEGE